MPSKPLKAIRPMFPSPQSWRIVRGDQVQVMVGKDKGKQGEVLRVIRDQRWPRVFVRGINLITRHIPKAVDKRGTVHPGFTVKMEAPIHYSNVMLLDPQSRKPVRTYFRFEDTPEGKRVRFTRGKHATNCIVPWPQKWKEEEPTNTLAGEKDTATEVAEEVTYDPANDFSMVLPSAHRRLKELRSLRQAAAAERAALQRERREDYRRLLVRSQAHPSAPAGAAGGGVGGGPGARSCSSWSGSSGGEGSSGGNSSSSSSSGSSSVVRPGVTMGLLCRSSRHSCRWGASSAMLQRLQWCGLAAAPCLVQT